MPRRTIRPTTAFIRRTYADGGDPLDITNALLESHREPMTLVECRPIQHVREMNDGDARRKIIAVPLGDPNYNYMFDISGFRNTCLTKSAISSPFTKELEGAHKTVVSKAQNREVANRVIVKCINYNGSFGKRTRKTRMENKKGESK